MSSKQSKFLTDNYHLRLPCHFSRTSRCSLKSHSSTCLSTPFENRVFEGGGPYSKDDEFPSLLTPSPANEEGQSPKKKRKKKKVFTVDSVPATKVVVIGAKHHKCRLHRDSKRSSGRQRLHSDSSCRTKRDSELERNQPFEQSKRARLAVCVVAVALIMLSVLLVGVTLRMAPVIDDLVRKENEEMYRAMSNLPSSAPVVPEVPATTNDTGTATGHPG